MTEFYDTSLGNIASVLLNEEKKQNLQLETTQGTLVKYYQN